MNNRVKFCVLLVLISFFGCNTTPENIVKIYSDQIISSNFIGNGVQWSAYPHADSENAEWGNLMTAEKWDMNFKRLDFMKPKLFRVMDQANWRYLVGFDKEDNPILSFDNPEVKAVEKILDYAQQNNISVLFGEWGTPYKVHDKKEGFSDKFTGANDPKWINCIVEYLDYLIIEKGYTCIKYYNLINEPNGDWASTKGDFNEWKEGVVLLSKAIKEKGLDTFITVAGPDAVHRYNNPNSTYSGIGWIEQSAKQLTEEIGIYEVHDYAKPSMVKSGEFQVFNEKAAKIPKALNKQIIFGEIGLGKSNATNQERAKNDPFASKDSQMMVYDYSYGIYMADAAIQIMNAGYSGAAAWALDDAMHTLDDIGNKNELKRWGMWNSLGTEICNNPEDENIRPWFYSWSLLCRYFPTGSSIIKTDETKIAGIRLTAATYKDDITVALINNSDIPNKITLDLSTSKTLRKYVYTAQDRKTDKNNFPVPVATNIICKDFLNIELPANSFLLLTTIKY
ncbi:cellulase family glycosylhydrolase [Polaribacter sp. Q13]|uniref:cellulase family glycosylhydrolase n=1 Tax=Polaribacter sp. Q13 TaxID=2806551 RepID=UPI00193BDDCB|nr:cellulase family glycosylhydrolase [Polaribacter sp. Q13]QVY66164.1 cellulase family glycosylhydrolase [Polaribacter sp. Q13]